jgi:hypothetical protein
VKPAPFLRAGWYALLFAVSIDLTTIGFGTIPPGGSVEHRNANHITVLTDEGSAWFLKVRHSGERPGLTLLFTSWGGDGIGTPAFIRMEPLDSVAYTAGFAERSNAPAGNRITFGYRIQAAPDASPGARTWVVTYTLTETL